MRAATGPRRRRRVSAATQHAALSAAAAPQGAAARAASSRRSSASASSASSACSSLLMLVTAIHEPRFVEADSLRDLSLNASIFAILAVGQTLVIITRNVDLSVGSVLGLSRVHRRRPVHPTTPASRSPSCSCSGSRSAPPAARSTARWSRSATCPRWWSRSARCTSSAASRSCGRAAARSTPDAARRLPDPRHRTRSSGSRSLALIALVVVVRRRPVRCATPRRPRAVRDRLQPRGRAARRRPVRAAASSPRSSLSRRARRPGRRPVHRPASAPSTRPPAPATSSRSIAAVVVGGVAIFGGTGTVYGAALGALLLDDHVGADRPEGRPLLAAGRIGALLLVAIALRPPAGAARRRRASQKERTPCRLTTAAGCPPPAAGAPPADAAPAGARPGCGARARALGDAARRAARRLLIVGQRDLAATS